MNSNSNSNSNTSSGGGSGGGFVPHLGAEPSSARYETVSAGEAVERVAAVGFARADAEHMVGEYLAEQTARHGEPAGGWQVDAYDLAEIARGYEWVDHYRGETIATARDRAGEYAADTAREAAQVDRDVRPGRGLWLDREAALWAERAHPTTSPTHNAADVGEHATVTDRDPVTDRDLVTGAAVGDQDDEGRTAVAGAAVGPAVGPTVGPTVGPRVVGLACPECEEEVTTSPPTTLAPYEAHGMERPGYSHLDGEPLCPVMGPRGYQPAEPVEIHADPDADAPAVRPPHTDAAPAVGPALDTMGGEPATDAVRHAHGAVAVGDAHRAVAQACNPPADDARRGQLTDWADQQSHDTTDAAVGVGADAITDGSSEDGPTSGGW